MKKYIKRLKTLLSDPSRSQNERVFIVLIILALTILFFALIGDIIYSENIRTWLMQKMVPLLRRTWLSQNAPNCPHYWYQ